MHKFFLEKSHVISFSGVLVMCRFLLLCELCVFCTVSFPVLVMCVLQMRSVRLSAVIVCVLSVLCSVLAVSRWNPTSALSRHNWVWCFVPAPAVDCMCPSCTLLHCALSWLALCRALLIDAAQPGVCFSAQQTCAGISDTSPS